MLSRSQDCPFLIPPSVHLKQIYPFMSTVILLSWILKCIRFLALWGLITTVITTIGKWGFVFFNWGGGGYTNHPLKTIVRFMVLNATFNNISAISWRSVLLVEETEVPRENHHPVPWKQRKIIKVKILVDLLLWLWNCHRSTKLMSFTFLMALIFQHPFFQQTFLTIHRQQVICKVKTNLCSHHSWYLLTLLRQNRNVT